MQKPARLIHDINSSKQPERNTGQAYTQTMDTYLTLHCKQLFAVLFVG